MAPSLTDTDPPRTRHAACPRARSAAAPHQREDCRRRSLSMQQPEGVPGALAADWARLRTGVYGTRLPDQFCPAVRGRSAAHCARHPRRYGPARPAAQAVNGLIEYDQPGHRVAMRADRLGWPLGQMSRASEHRAAQAAHSAHLGARIHHLKETAGRDYGAGPRSGLSSRSPHLTRTGTASWRTTVVLRSAGLPCAGHGWLCADMDVGGPDGWAVRGFRA